MGIVRIISKSRIYAASYKQANFRRIELTPWDLRVRLSLDYIQKGLLFYKPKPEKESQNTFNIQHLKSSLSQTLDLFFPLAGRLGTVDHHDDNTTSFFIDCNNAGAKFVHAIMDGVCVADIVQPIYVPDKTVYPLFPLSGVVDYEGTSNPLLAVQVTELLDGIFLGFAINHVVVDALPFWHFVNSWSQISRGFECLCQPPVLERWFLRHTDYPIRIPCMSIDQLKYRVVRPPNLKHKVFHFPRENIAKLKAKANAEIGTNKISSLQALLSHFWRSVVRNKVLDHDKEMFLRMPICVRSRMNPPLPQHYLGNATRGDSVKMKSGELVEKGLGYVALQINKMVAAQTDESIKTFLESWIENPQLVKFDTVVSNSLIVGGSPRFNVYGNDFGWGRPIAVRSGPANRIEGMAVLFAGVEEGSVDIEATLLLDALNGMGKDTEFMDAVTS